MRLPVNASTRGMVFLFSFAMALMYQGTGHCGEKADPGTDYHTIVKRLKNGDTSIDYARLRYSYTETKDYNPYSRIDANRDAMMEALDANKHEIVIKHAQAVLEKNYVDLDAHFISRIGFRELKNTEKLNFHTTVLKGLMKSIYDSGNGQTPETAFVVISTDEEYVLLKMNGYKVVKQALIEINGRKFDKMETEKVKTGEKDIFYFNIDIPMRWLNTQLGGKSK